MTSHPSPPVPLAEAHQRLLQHFGPQGWWPAETPFEVCVGAILVQNTAWTNVERALVAVKQANLLDPVRLLALPPERLEELIRPAGTYRIKAARLRKFLEVLVHEHAASLDRLFAGPVKAVRERLLAIHGIGPETADCLLLYAGERPSFVVDAYTRRVFARHGWPGVDSPYAELQQVCSTALVPNEGVDPVPLWQEFHALMVAVGKHFCAATTPRCEGCPLRVMLTGSSVVITDPDSSRKRASANPPTIPGSRNGSDPDRRRI